RHAVGHAATTTEHSDGHVVGIAAFVRQAERVRRFGVGATDGNVILKNGDVWKREQVGPLFTIYVVDVVGTAVRRVQELTHELEPREPWVIIPKWLRRLLPRIHKWTGEVRFR